MNPRIRALSGPLKGMEFPLDSNDLVIGRDKSCRVHLADDPGVSPKHCILTAENGLAVLINRAKNGSTFVNGFCFPGKVLGHGDHIWVSRSIFVYLVHEEVDEALLKLTPEEEKWTRSSDPPESGKPYEAAKTAVLQAFLQMTASINSISDSEEIQARVLDLIFKVMPAERAAILLAGGGDDRFVSTTCRRAGPQTDEPFAIDEAAAWKCLRESAPIYGEKVIFYPLIALDKKVGVIYAAMAPVGGEYFIGAHLNLLESITGATAVVLEHARYVAWLEGENRRLKAVVNVEHGMIGQSRPMKDVYELVARAGPSDRTVLITGESGTGKELVAKAIFQNSRRAQNGFYAVNCAAFTESLLESELFGHERGAFTDAKTLRQGLFEVADGATTFLDEVGELSPRMQTDLLRALQEGEIRRIGNPKAIKVNVRVIAATNRNLKLMVKEGRFREDLYYRLNVIEIPMPPLRDRREDIPLLAAFFILKHGQFRSDPFPAVMGLSREAQLLLTSYDWPGNVRELENAIQRAIALGASAFIQPDELPNALKGDAAEQGQLGLWHAELDAAKKAILERALRKTDGNRTEAAQLLGLHPTYFSQLCRDLKVKWP